jgi:hypothetical protein
MPYDLWCFVVGRDDVFSVTVDETRTVGHLKKHIYIQAEMHPDLDSFGPHDLTLYQIQVDASDDERTYIKELKKLSQTLNELKALFVWLELSEVFVGGPPEQKIHILVQPPQKQK